MELFNLKPKIILGADVLYDTNGRIFCTSRLFLPSINEEIMLTHMCRLAFDDLFATVTFLLQNTLGSVFITAYHNRR